MMRKKYFLNKPVFHSQSIWLVSKYTALCFVRFLAVIYKTGCVRWSKQATRFSSHPLSTHSVSTQFDPLFSYKTNLCSCARPSSTIYSEATVTLISNLPNWKQDALILSINVTFHLIEYSSGSWLWYSDLNFFTIWWP